MNNGNTGDNKVWIDSPPSTSSALPPEDIATSSATIDNTSTIDVRYGRCPICNQKYPFSIIQEHADICLENKQKPLIYTIESDDDNVVDKVEEEPLQAVAPKGIESTIDVRPKIQQIIKQCHLQEGEALINVVRGVEFRDFMKFFSKTWNKNKLNKSYSIYFIGAPAVDTGGVTIEFHTGNSALSI